jgi:hypothetical protein
MSTVTVADAASGAPSAGEFEHFFREHYRQKEKVTIEALVIDHVEPPAPN